MPLQFQNYAQAYANPVQRVARDRSQSVKDIGSAIDEMIAKGDLAKERKSREALLSDADKQKLDQANIELNTMNRELSSLQAQRSDILQKMADIKNNLPQEDYQPVAGTSTDTENTSKADEREFTYEDMAV
jgi:hypothetical protein